MLMVVFEQNLPPLGNDKYLRISWFENESCTKVDQGVQVNADESAMLETLSQDYGRFYESETNTDCVLKVGEAQFPVHRQVLSARSTVFEAMFRHDTSESRSGIVDIPDTDSSVMNNVLFYVYTGKVRSLTADSAVPMYVVADKYALVEFRNKCMNFLCRSLTLENFCDAAMLAHNHGETQLEIEVILFIKERSKDLVNNENWKHFLSTQSVLASRLLFSALLTNDRNEKMS